MVAFTPISGDDIKTEAWVLRNLITVLAGAARRPHTPRSPEMRALFRAIGIDVPEPAVANGSLVATYLQHWNSIAPQLKKKKNINPNLDFENRPWGTDDDADDQEVQDEAAESEDEFMEDPIVDETEAGMKTTPPFINKSNKSLAYLYHLYL